MPAVLKEKAMTVIRDSGFVIVYDMKNQGKPVTMHRIDAKEALAHKAGRWAVSPDGEAMSKAQGVGGATQPDGIVPDDGETMRLKATPYKTLQVMAGEAGIENWKDMSKADLVQALTASKDDGV